MSESGLAPLGESPIGGRIYYGSQENDLMVLLRL